MKPAMPCPVRPNGRHSWRGGKCPCGLTFTEQGRAYNKLREERIRQEGRDEVRRMEFAPRRDEKEKRMVRAKFVVQEKTLYSWNKDSVRIKLGPQYDSTIPEDQRFAKATPNGEFWMQVDNPAAAAALELGKAYYIDLTPAEDAQ